MTTGLFTCPTCNALYQVVKGECGPETVDRKVTCCACGAPMPNREGKFLLKYFWLRNAARRSQKRGTHKSAR